MGGLLGGVGALFSGIAALVTLLVRRHRAAAQQDGQAGEALPGAPDPAAPAWHGDPLLWTASAAAFALAAFVLAAAVVIQGLVPHSLPTQFTLLAAECFGLLSVFAGFGIVLVLREQGSVTVEVGGLALLTGFVALAGMAMVA